MKKMRFPARATAAVAFLALFGGCAVYEGGDRAYKIPPGHMPPHRDNAGYGFLGSLRASSRPLATAVNCATVFRMARC